MLELLSPAGSPEAVVASVQSGADAIYMGFGGFNARRGAKNFSDEEFDTAVRYCRVRGCKVYLTLNTLVNDREIDEVIKLACHAAEVGVDAILVQDIGLLRILRCVLPDMPLHASTQMSIHNLAGVEAAAEMGVSRAVLARELSLEQIRTIAEKSPIELEVFAHGAFCFCHSGQCYMSSMIGRRSGNRGSCAQPCRLQYSLGGRMDDFPLSLKDSCLVNHLDELEDAGVACVKIEGRMKRPEYSAIVTGIYSRAIHDKKKPTEIEMQQLETAFSRQGFTEGYFKGKLGPDMFRVRGEPDREANKLYNAARKEYAHAEARRVPVKFFAMVRRDEISKFAVEDTDGHRIIKTGPVPQDAEKQAVSEASLHEQLYKTGGTPFYCEKMEAIVDDGLFLPVSLINEVRRNLLEELTEARRTVLTPKIGDVPKTPLNVEVLGKPKKIFQVTQANQLTEELAAQKPDYIYVPMVILANKPDAVLPFVKQGTIPVVVLPRVITDTEKEKVWDMLVKIRKMGVEEALLGNMGHIRFARIAGFKIRGDFGLNAFNSDSLQVLHAAGFLSATASFELRMSQIRDMQKPLNTEMFVYGRMPLMVSDNCIIHNSTGECSCEKPASLTDRAGKVFPVAREFEHRNQIFNAHKLYLADKHDYEKVGVWGARQLFTIESPDECVRIAKTYAGEIQYIPNGITRGLYFRGVE